MVIRLRLREDFLFFGGLVSLVWFLVSFFEGKEIFIYWVLFLSEELDLFCLVILRSVGYCVFFVKEKIKVKRDEIICFRLVEFVFVFVLSYIVEEGKGW